MSTAKTAKKPKPNREKLTAEMVKDDPAWIPGRAAAKRVGISIPLFYEILKTGQIETFLFKRHPHSKAGIRLVYWPSLASYMRRRCKEANQDGQTVWVPVRAKGWSIKKEVPAA